MPRKLRQSGFHLIELLIILAMFSLAAHWISGNYQTQIARARRWEAGRELLQLSAALEEYALTSFTYAQASLQDLHIPPLIADAHYALQIEIADAFHYVISARPLANQTSVDQDCGTLRFTSAGEKMVTGSQPWYVCWPGI